MKNKKLIIYIFLAVICMCSIFVFSSKNTTDSNGTSQGLINTAINIYEKVTNKNIDNLKLVKKLNYPIRKLAHYSIYFLLGIFIYKCLLCFRFRYKELIAIIICISYALLDEFHQLFVSGRTGQLKDVFIDTLGSITAILIIMFLSKRNSLSKKVKNQIR